MKGACHLLDGKPLILLEADFKVRSVSSYAVIPGMSGETILKSRPALRAGERLEIGAVDQ